MNLVMAGRAHYHLHQYDKARDLFTRAVNVSPRSPDERQVHLQIFHQTGRHREIYHDRVIPRIHLFPSNRIVMKYKMKLLTCSRTLTPYADLFVAGTCKSCRNAEEVASPPPLVFSINKDINFLEIYQTHPNPTFIPSGSVSRLYCVRGILALI